MDNRSKRKGIAQGARVDDANDLAEMTSSPAPLSKDRTYFHVIYPHPDSRRRVFFIHT